MHHSTTVRRCRPLEGDRTNELLRLCTKRENPPNGSLGIVQVLSKTQRPLELFAFCAMPLPEYYRSDKASIILSHSPTLKLSARLCSSTSALHRPMLAPPFRLIKSCKCDGALRRLFRIVFLFCINPALTISQSNSSCCTSNSIFGRNVNRITLLHTLGLG